MYNVTFCLPAAHEPNSSLDGVRKQSMTRYRSTYSARRATDVADHDHILSQARKQA